MKLIAILFLRGYQLLFSPFFGQQCRFTPTCSQYAIEVIQKKGLTQGIFLLMKRIGKCHPWCKGGHDPVS
ncbi:MAG: membrane protein insertion efficiency factor YidD [Candidatus Methylopumilus sp.]